MANEAVIVELLGNRGSPIKFKCASGTAIAKGSLMELTGDRTVTMNNGAGDVIVGVAAAAKAGDDYSTEIAVYTHGIFDLTIVTGGDVTRGNDVRTSGANLIDDFATLDNENGKAIGKALHTGTAAGVVQVIIGGP